jgi:hypothetical protein
MNMNAFFEAALQIGAILAITAMGIVGISYFDVRQAGMISPATFVP